MLSPTFAHPSPVPVSTLARAHFPAPFSCPFVYCSVALPTRKEGGISIATRRVFIALSITGLGMAMMLLGQTLEQWLNETGKELPKWAEGWIALPPLILVASYLFLVWGFLSRRCEMLLLTRKVFLSRLLFDNSIW